MNGTTATKSIVFVQRELEDKLGPMVLVAYLKKHGYPASIVIDPLKNIETIKKLAPALIGISVLTPSVRWALSTAKTIKKHLPQTIMILGGPHATFFPEVVSEDGIDIVCRGEGERALLNIISSFDGTIESVQHTPNCWVKNGIDIIINEVGPLLNDQELTELANCDRSHYAQHPALRNNPHKKTWATRGCPFGCSFCFNHQYNQLYVSRGNIVRTRSVESLIGELLELKEFGWRCLEVVDDQFLASAEWLKEFCAQYERRIHMPFACNSTAKQINPETVGLLKKAGCINVCFGIESGDESLRRKVYNKPLSDEEIIQAAEVLHAFGMPFMTFNMVGLPQETIEDIYKTIEINQKINTPYPWCSIVQPYPGTRIADYFHVPKGKEGLHFSYSYFDSSLVDDARKAKIFYNAQKLFAHFVKSKTGLKKFSSMVARPPLHLDRLYPSVFYWHYGRDIKRRYGMSWFSLLRYWMYSRAS